jgi:ATP-binding cassette subfamily F protein 3
MGQNGAGKSTIVKLISGALRPNAGSVNSSIGMTVSVAKQVMPKECMKLNVREYFLKYLNDNDSGLDGRINKVLQMVNLTAPLDREVCSFSGGQQARLLLAAALINNPDILILDEPTNNLDFEGINDLTQFIQEYNNTCMVISHDEQFLNSFSDSVLYLDCYSKKIEQYDGDYHSVKKEISRRISKEMAENSRKEKLANEKKAQANVFANKGGGMRSVAKKLRTEAENLNESIVDVKREDKSLRSFIIPMQATTELQGASTCMMELTGIKAPPAPYEPHSTSIRSLKLGPVTIHKGFRLRLVGPNGCGKTTVLRSLLDSRYQSKVCKIRDSNLRIGYYSQDFSELDASKTVIETLYAASMDRNHNEQYIRHVAANFFLTGSEMMKQKVGTLSEGQKALLAFASLVLMEPGLLILDEPTNHINFRHLPAIAKALASFEGGMIVVSHDKDFVSKVKVHKELNLCTDVVR